MRKWAPVTVGKGRLEVDADAHSLWAGSTPSLATAGAARVAMPVAGRGATGLIRAP